MSFPPLAAGRGVTQVVDRCETAKSSGFLDLSSCSLMFIADAIYLLLKGYDITKVSIRDNDLKKFPKKFLEKFPGTTIFNMEKNGISELPAELSQWTKMRGMNAANNQLTSFPEGIYSMTSLALLDLSGNQIEELDVDRLFSSCTCLVQLNLAGNPLNEETKKLLLSSPKKPEKLKIKLE